MRMHLNVVSATDLDATTVTDAMTEHSMRYTIGCFALCFRTTHTAHTGMKAKLEMKYALARVRDSKCKICLGSFISNCKWPRRETRARQLSGNILTRVSEVRKRI